MVLRYQDGLGPEAAVVHLGPGTFWAGEAGQLSVQPGALWGGPGQGLAPGS